MHVAYRYWRNKWLHRSNRESQINNSRRQKRWKVRETTSRNRLAVVVRIPRSRWHNGEFPCAAFVEGARQRNLRDPCVVRSMPEEPPTFHFHFLSTAIDKAILMARDARGTWLRPQVLTVVENALVERILNGIPSQSQRTHSSACSRSIDRSTRES